MKTFIGWLWVLAALVAALGSIQASAEENSQAEAFAEGKTVKLPPYIVTGQAVSRWRYVSAPGFEVISMRGDWETTLFVETLVSQDRKLAEILPDFLRVKQSMPVTMILITHRMADRMRVQMAEAMKGKMILQRHDESHSTLFEVIPQMVFWDDESVSMMYEPYDGDYSALSFTPEHVQQLLMRRVPKLPVWFGAGIISIYQEIRWKDETISLPELPWPMSQTPDRKGNLTIPEAIMPMREFLVGPWGGQSQGSVSRYNRWLLQADLFLRWAFDDKSRARREALWRFADRSSREPATEGLFKQCFGMGFSDMEKELTSFIPRARKAPIDVFDSVSVKSPDLSAVRDATAGEVAWIKGSFDLKEIDYVRKNLPVYVDQYIGQAEADLIGPYRKGARDPEFLAVLGLYYSSIGRDNLAQPLLEQAAAAHVSRLSVYIELARIRKTNASVPSLASDP